MKAKELMIGDWVHYRGTNIKVTSLYNKGGSNEIGWSNKESVWVNAINVEPIPITNDILTKIGAVLYDSFARIDIGNHYILYDYDGFLTICNVDDNVRIISYLNCDYIHQLQHALRLCRIYKQIKL